MATTKALTNIEDEEKQDTNSLNIMDIVGLCISNWFWFALCLSVSMSIAYIYLRIVPPVFTRSTSIVVKEDSRASELDNIFSRGRIGRSSSALNNEIIALRKPALMAKVVQRLNLDYEYQIQGRLRNTTLYASSLPLYVTVTGGRDFSKFRVNVANDGTVTLKSADNWGNIKQIVNSREFTGKMNKPIKTPIGIVTVHPGPAYASRTNDDITVLHSSVEAAAGQFLSRLSVINTDDASTVIDLSLRDVNIERADDILNTLIAVYNEQWIENRNQVIVATNKFISERLQAIEYELGDVEAEMTSYKVANHTLDYSAEGAQYQSRSMQYENQGVSFENELALTRYFHDYVEKIKDNNQTLPLSAGINNNALSSQVAQYNTLVLQRNNLISASSESNPLVSDIDRQMQVLRHGIMVTIDNHIGMLNTQVQMLNANEEKNNARIDATPGKQKQYIDIERRRKIKEQLYTFLLQTREQNELNQAFAAYNTRVLQPAGGSNVQSFPDVKKVRMWALGVGLLLPLLLIVLREWMNTKVRGRKDVESLTVPFVGELPYVELVDDTKLSLSERIKHGYEGFKDSLPSLPGKKKKRKSKLHQGERVVVRAGSRNVINEAFRVLRTNLEFIIGHDPSIKVIMTSSANPGSGKTFISYNMALCMSLKKKKTVVLDLDLRRHNLSSYVEQPEVGISDYINGFVDDWHDVLKKSPDGEYLDVIPVGTVPPNPAEILAYDTFGKLIEELRQEYDYVFLDCPPVEIVADTSIIARYADITLFVIRVGLMELAFKHVIEEYYHDHKFNNMGIILNGTLTANSRYGYRRYGYRYGYGYGYGYGGYGYYGSGYSSGYSDGYSHKS